MSDNMDSVNIIIHSLETGRLLSPEVSLYLIVVTNGQ